MPSHTHRAVPILLITALCTALGAACGSNATVATPPNQSQVAGESAPASAAPSPTLAVSDAVSGSAMRMKAMEPGQTGSGLPSANEIAAPSMVIRNGNATVQVDSLELAIAAVQRLAAALGGYVGNSTVAAGENQMRSASIELKIPAARFDEALSGLKPIGKVEAVSSTAEDVGEEYVDVTARMNNAKRLEERLVTLLATRAGKLEDVLAVERELARVREEIERYEGRLRFLKTRVATSTLNVNVHERAPLVSAAPGENIMLDALKDAWRNFVRFSAGLVSSLGVLVPIGVLLLIGVRVWKRYRPAVVVKKGEGE